MNQTPQPHYALRIARRITRWSIFATLGFCLALPSAYLAIRYESETEVLDAELELDRILLERIINRDPELWRFKGDRLHDAIASHKVATELPIRHRVLDLQGNEVAKLGDTFPPPALRRSIVLNESAGPTGTLVIEFSLRPLGLEIGLVLLGAVILAGVALFTLRRVAIQPLQRLPEELAAAEAGRRLASRAVEAASNPIIIVSATAPDYPIEYVNHAFEQLTGYLLAEVKGRNCRLLQGEDRAQPELSEIRSAVSESRATRVRLRNYRKDGTLFWNELNIAPVFDVQGMVTHFVGELIDITDSLHTAEVLRFQATHDPLTDLPNRRMLAEQLTESIAQADRLGQRLSVAYIDLDGFKFVNDSLGHEAGDQVLAETAQRLATCVPDADLLARVGGDEFVLVLHGHASDATIYEILRRIQKQLAEPIQFELHEFRIGGSIGVAVFPGDGSDAETLLRNADLAMYHVKQSGRGSIQFYASEMHTSIHQRLAWEQDLRAALEHDGELRLHFQPQVSLQDGRIVGLEALVRWQHPKHGMVMPAQFIALAEEIGLIDSLGQWVLRTACQQARAWQAAGLLSGAVAVNVSAYQFIRPDFIATVAAALADTGADPANLELEITESASMRDPQDTVRILRALKDMGVKLSIDDFGTGYSNLGYLHQFPVDMLKLDQSFVRNAPDDPGDRAICEATVALAHSLGLHVIAEGVETEAQLALLAHIGCDEVQGYLFSRPLAAEACTELLQSDRHLPVEHLHVRPIRPTVLLVDDDSFMRHELEQILAPDGYFVLKADSGDKALELMSRNIVNVVISDNRMPGMTGLEMLEKLRVRHPETSCILLSGLTTVDMLMTAVNRGDVFRVLTKPCEPAALRQAVAEALRHSLAATQFGERPSAPPPPPAR